MIKSLISFYFILTLNFAHTQEKKPIIKHEFEIGATGQLHTDGTGLKYYNIFDEPYVLGGRKRNSFITLFVPKISFNYSRHINDRVYTFGYLYFFNESYNSKYNRTIYYMALNLGFQHKNLFKSAIFTLRPKFSVQLNYSQDSKIDHFGNIIYDHNSILKLRPALGFGLNFKIYFIKRIFLTNEFLYVLHHKPESYFFQHNLYLGYRF